MDADADDDDDAVKTELNHTPTERDRDLKDEEEEELLLRRRPPPLSDSGPDHAGLRGHRSCSGSRLPDPDPDDDGARLPRRSPPAMLRGAMVGRQTRSRVAPSSAARAGGSEMEMGMGMG